MREPNLAGVSDRPGALWRILLLVFCALTALLAIAELSDAIGLGQRPWYGIWGATMGSAGSPYMAKILSIDPGRAADRAGLRSGDLFDVRANGLAERFAVLSEGGQPLSGKPIRLSVTRGARHLDLTVSPLPPDDTRRLQEVVAPIAVLWLALFASIIAWRRAYVPGNLLLSSVLLLTAIVSGAPSQGFAAPWAWVYVVLSICLLAAPLGVALWATYASGFAPPLSRPRRAVQLTCYALVAVAMAIGVSQLIGIITLWFDPVDLSLQPIWTLPMVAAVLAALGCSILAIAECRGIDRQRATWTLVPLPFVYLAFQALLFINFTSSAYGVVMGTRIVHSAITFVAPLALTYAAVNRKLIDLGFVLNRTLVFATVSAIVVGVFVLAEWAASEWFVSASHTSSVVVGMLVALALGLSMRYIHRYVDRFVDRVFFQKRHEDEAALRAFAHEASYITDRSVLLDRSVQAVRRHTDTDHVAIFLRGDSDSYREYTNGRSAVISENDSAVVSLRAWGKPLDLDQTTGSQLRGAIAFPMTARGVLIGALVCGPKTSGESFAPDEIESLVALAHGVAIALESLNRESSDSIASLRESLAGLRTSIATMRDDVVAELRALGSSLRS